MHFLRRVFPFLLLPCPAAAGAAPYSTDFALSPDATSMRTLTRLHRGDRIQLQSPRLLGNEIVLLVQCLDGCTKTKIIRGWHGRASAARKGPDLLERVTILQDADYFVAAHEIPTTVQPTVFRGCIRSLPLHVLCGDARPLRITEAKADGEWFRARLNSSSWVWVRYTRR